MVFDGILAFVASSDILLKFLIVSYGYAVVFNDILSYSIVFCGTLRHSLVLCVIHFSLEMFFWYPVVSCVIAQYPTVSDIFIRLK